MITLYLDTSSSFLYSGIVKDGELLDNVKCDLGKELSTFSLSRISGMFINNNLKPNDINRIILVNGPGSFTGVRIAITIAKTYAWALDIPIITISSLEAMAVSVNEDVDFLVPIIDARRGNVYGAIYDKNYNIVLKEQHVSLDILKIALEKLGDSYKFISNNSFDFSCIPYDPDILKIVNKFMNRSPIASHEVDANYLKLTEAEEKLNDN